MEINQVLFFKIISTHVHIGILKICKVLVNSPAIPWEFGSLLCLQNQSFLRLTFLDGVLKFKLSSMKKRSKKWAVNFIFTKDHNISVSTKELKTKTSTSSEVFSDVCASRDWIILNSKKSSCISVSTNGWKTKTVPDSEGILMSLGQLRMIIHQQIEMTWNCLQWRSEAKNG